MLRILRINIAYLSKFDLTTNYICIIIYPILTFELCNVTSTKRVCNVICLHPLNTEKKIITQKTHDKYLKPVKLQRKIQGYLACFLTPLCSLQVLFFISQRYSHTVRKCEKDLLHFPISLSICIL
jgi:hypothetical protein